jgi:hypothetical protein
MEVIKMAGWRNDWLETRYLRRFGDEMEHFVPETIMSNVRLPAGLWGDEGSFSSAWLNVEQERSKRFSVRRYIHVRIHTASISVELRSFLE